MMTPAAALRPMTPADLPGVRESAGAAFQDLHQRLGQPSPGQASESGPALTRQLLDLDAAGAWVATVDGEVCGTAMAGLREGLWYLGVLRADQQWAIDVAHRAGLDLSPLGPLCRQGDTGPLAPYLPHTGVL